MRFALVATYLSAIIAANLSLNHWGPQAAIWNAVALIGLDLIARDRLHDAWHGRLVRNMGMLIMSGSALSYVFGLWLGSGPAIGRIALASCVAFGAAAVADAVVYHWRRHRSWADRSNESNIAGAAVDSIVFLALIPFPFSWTLALSLWSAKVAGGYVWSVILRSRLPVAAAVADPRT